MLPLVVCIAVHVCIACLMIYFDLDQACWSIAEEEGVKIISDSIKSFPNSADVVSFGCMALSSLPRKGTRTIFSAVILNTNYKCLASHNNNYRPRTHEIRIAHLGYKYQSICSLHNAGYTADTLI